MLKKIFIFTFLLSIIFSLPVSAASTDFSLSAQNEFSVMGTETKAVCEILGINQSDLDKYCNDNHIKYLAVNKDNTKQISLSVKTTDFSTAVVNISTFTDDKINSLLPDIIGIENARGESVFLDGQKFIKTQLKSTDSGGEFILTQYITIADRKTYILSFHTSAATDSGYIQEVFESFKCEAFITESNNNKLFDLLRYILPITVIIFAAICSILIYTIIRDIKKNKTV